MPYINAVPKHVVKEQLPGLKIGALVKTLHSDYSQAKNSFEQKMLPAGSVGRVKKIFDFDCKTHRFYCSIKFEGHPVTTFYTEELAKVKL